MLSRQKSLKGLLFVVIAGALLWGVGGQPVFAQNAADIVPATWYVSNTGEDLNSCLTTDAPCATINAAIAKATAGDTIDVATGTYTGTGTEVVMIDRDLTLSGGWDAGFATQSGLSTIDGQSLRRGVSIYNHDPSDPSTLPGVTAEINHFSIENGLTDSSGGGIYQWKGTLTISSSIIHNNWGRIPGGGIDIYGTLTVNDSAITGNTGGQVGYSGGGGGGGVRLVGTAVFTNSSITSNKILGHFEGSAIYSGSGPVTLNGTTVSNNTGAVAIYGHYGQLVLKNTTVSGNLAGGLSQAGGTLALKNTTITGNAAVSGSGLANSPSYTGTVQMQNTILAGNTRANGNPADCSGTISSSGYNLIGSNAGCTFAATTGDQVGTATAPIDPKLDPLADHGGFTFTHALALNSPALDAGNPAAPGSGVDACLAIDQRGLARPVDSACDIGAYEGHVAMVESIARADPNPTSANTVNFTVTFSEAVTGVETTAPFSDFALTASGVTGAAITAVSGSGSTYTVTVNTGTGIGTLRLDLIDDDTILDASNIPLGGPPTGNGNFTSGQAYTLPKPVVSSVIRASANPTTAASVQFTVTFSQSVTGVNKVPPFSDFSLTTTGVAGASIKSVTGSGKTYTVTVGTGSGNGTIRLNVVDHDTIMDGRTTPLGGAGTGNGNFTTGQAFTVIKFPTPQFPTGAIWDTTPAYQWSKVPLATQYSYQLFKGTTLIYSKTLLASACGASACANTPATQLAPGVYKWRARAMLGGLWKTYSPYKTLKLYAPKAGYWSGSWSNFYVTPGRVQISRFSINISVRGCGNYRITKRVLLPISNTGNFGFNGAFTAYGTFSDTTLNPTSASGAATLGSYYIGGCGYVSGSAPWDATWINSSQPDAAQQDLGSFILVPTLNGPLGLLSTDSFTLDP